MSNIKVNGITYNGVNTIKIKNTNNEYVDFNENPFIVDVSQTPNEAYLNKLCQDANSGQLFMVKRGNSNSFALHSFPESVCIDDIKYGGGHLVIGCHTSSSGCIYHSTDGKNWTQCLSISGTFRIKCAYGKGKWAFSLGGTVKYIYWTEDFLSFTKVIVTTSTSIGNFYNIVYGNGRFVLIPNTGSSLYYSDDLTTWRLTSSTLNLVTFANGYFYQKATNGWQKSLDCINWTDTLPTTFSDGSNTFSYLYYFNGKYFMVVSNWKLLYCEEGDTQWTVVDFYDMFSPAPNFYSMSYVNGKYYIGCDKGRILESSDLVNFSFNEFITENTAISVLATDGSILLGGFGYYTTTYFSDYVISDSSNNFYYCPIYF